MNNVKFAKETIVSVLSKMEKVREKEECKQYRTLSDTLREIVDIVRKDFSVNNVDPFTVLLEEEIKKEINSLTAIVNKSIENDNFREHHDWIIAFRKLDYIRDSLLHGNKRIEDKNNLPQYLEKRVINAKGIHVVVSSTKHISIQKAIKNLLLIEDNIKIHGNREFKYSDDHRNVFAYGLSDLIRGKRGEVLHIDKQINLKNYMNYIDSMVNSFDIVNMI